MPSMRDIKEKIASTKQMRKITKAMQMVAAAKLNRAQSAAEDYAAYADKLHEVVASIASTMSKGASSKHPMLAARPVKKTAYLVITESRGLAGAYDSTVLKYVQNLIREKHQSKDEYTIIVTGKVGLNFFTKRGYPVAFSKADVPDDLTFDNILAFAKQAVSLFNKKEIDELHLVYNHFVNAISQTLVDKQLLPLTNLEHAPAQKVSYVYEPDEDEVLTDLLPLYAQGQIYGALLDAKAAEQAARMTAMRSASDNASDIIDRLSLSYNRARQAAITQEITEIVGGAAALE
ncbi:ATP synthase F1 subunit gamma [Sporolactobacillus terrae]|uniref:ATP synthase gamma chain n=1 Tax=Sporolactobacillus terrae TaxID=269673 RepID=A0A410DCB1_9BACL|nr:ATP synthase F1 subunit gamma [Sporolactobacillus terrae]QAA23652.1 ATP synthase F1 subunit gamma [Sporolactobacillus terrae]QAA26622.1 ATP synthase F1 subunit gamma [Sporolactobacillus terrae]UAK15692.1 ATP synthase F1 subunit gamma [Sporolactobacillus terrae]BBO00176.1 ATP synthase gamma chain [Sporolactobacillus terrae]